MFVNCFSDQYSINFDVDYIFIVTVDNLRMDACFFTEVTGQFMILYSKDMCDLYRSPGSVIVGCACS